MMFFGTSELTEELITNEHSFKISKNIIIFKITVLHFNIF